MADTKISALTAVTTPAGTDEFAVNQGGTSKKETRAQILTADVHASFSEYTGQAADPAAPTSAMRFYTRPIGGRYLPRFIGPSGLDSALQPGMWANNIVMWLAGTSSTAAINFGTSWTVAATQATPNIANTNFMTQIKRATFTTNTTAANACGIRSAAPICWRGNAAGQGGFFFSAVWGVTTFSSTMRAWCGLSALTTLLAGDPSAQNDTCVMSKDSADTVWQLLTRDTTTANKTSTGRTVVAAGTTDIFQFVMFCKPNDTQITFLLIDIATDTTISNNVSTSTNLPTNTAMLTAHCECMNVAGGAGSAVAVFLNKMYIETDN